MGHGGAGSINSGHSTQSSSIIAREALKRRRRRGVACWPTCFVLALCPAEPVFFVLLGDRGSPHVPQKTAADSGTGIGVVMTPIPARQCALHSATIAAQWRAEPSFLFPSFVARGTMLAGVRGHAGGQGAVAAQRQSAAHRRPRGTHVRVLRAARRQECATRPPAQSQNRLELQSLGIAAGDPCIPSPPPSLRANLAAAAPIWHLYIIL